MPTPLLALLFAVRVLNVLYSPIPDCDEVFNYYEPLNFLLRGFGKQTWEYSPEYVIRSWAYLLPFWILSPFTMALDYIGGPYYVAFYVIRVLLVIGSTYAEYHMAITLKKFNKQLSNWFTILSAVCTGMSHASVALLPSSLAMNCALLATSNFLRYIKTRSTRNALLVTSWLCIGGLFGWPFVLALGVPTMVYIIWEQWNSVKCGRYIRWSIAIGFIYLATSMEVDYAFYGKTVVVPLNIVLYNVIHANEESGPNIFGVEPVSYYINNLLLNFHIIAPLAYASITMVLFSWLFTKNRFYKGVIYGVLAPMWLWTLIFFKQPHKEERFLYPIYGLINLSGALTLTLSLSAMNSLLHLCLKRKTVKLINKAIVFTIGSLIITVSLLRTVSFSLNYDTPLSVYQQLPRTSGNLCVGREWYRYPSSFFLPPQMRLKFIESGFRGLLPGDFDEDAWLLPAIQSIPKGMNNMNLYDPGKVVAVDVCDYAIDISQSTGEGEYNFANDQWELLYTAPFLNNEQSHGVGKYLWIPEQLHDLFKTNLSYHDYNLYKRITENT
jgi:alpha-1,2-mannosyltransferase